MATVIAQTSAVDVKHPGINNSELQERPIFIDVNGAMPDNDDVLYVFPAAGDTGLPPRGVHVYRHTGADLTSAASATFVLSDGATLDFQADTDGNGVVETLKHILDGVSAGAATPVEIAASINADTALQGKVHAVAGLTTNAVTLFPVGPRATLRVVGGTASALLAFPGTLANNANRTYVSQALAIAGGTGFSWSYAGAARTLTVVNETGGAVNRVTVLVDR